MISESSAGNRICWPCGPATAALESGGYAQRAGGEQDAAIRTARNAPMRIEEHIDANE